MPLSKQRISRMVIMLLAMLFFLSMSGVIWAGLRMVEEVNRKFGPPDASLTTYHKVSYVIQLYFRKGDILRPVDPKGEAREFIVELGETIPSISARLADEGLISNPETFRIYLVYSGLDKGVQAGLYQLSPRMTASEIALALQDATPATVKFVILAGWRLEEIAAALPTSGLSFSADDLLLAATQPGSLILSPELGTLSKLEGYFFPATYNFDRDITATEITSDVVSRFMESLTPDMLDGYARNGLSLEQAVILASIIQKETVIEEELPMIASVFYNRLHQGMRLESDPTVQYALGYQVDGKTWWKNPLDGYDLGFDSPFNTYLHPGLPPTPICNPGLASLRAVAYPAETPYYFFRTACDHSGRHEFAITFDEHLQNNCP